jgi:hypothetical protein
MRLNKIKISGRFKNELMGIFDHYLKMFFTGHFMMKKICELIILYPFFMVIF